MNSARAHAERLNTIQRYFVERTRLGIPIIPFEEAAHGLLADGATAFPQAIALAATWDTALVARVSAAIARETRTRGVRQVLSPVINIATDPRWGRVEETYGEDPLLTSQMATAIVSAFERAGVVVTRRSGREKLHFLNPVPIRMIHDRWIDKYTERRVSALLELKTDLEAKAWRQSRKPA